MAKRMKKQTPAEIRKVLRAAAGSDGVVEIWHRESRSYDCAQIIEVGRNFVSYLEIDTDSMTYCGPTVLRLRIVDKVVARLHDGNFIPLGLRLLGRVRPAVPAIRLDKIAHAIVDLSTRSQIIEIRCADIMTNACWLGRVEEISGNEVLLTECRPRGRWSVKKLRFPLVQINKVTINSGYADALLLVANHYYDLDQRAEQKVKPPSARKKSKLH
jgi:hypothetical protein